MNTYFSGLAKRSGITPEPVQTLSRKTQTGTASEPGKRSMPLMENSEPTYYVENASSEAESLATADTTQERKHSIATTAEARTDSSLMQTELTEANVTSRAMQAASPPGSQHQPRDNSLSSRPIQSGSLGDSVQEHLLKPAAQPSAPTVVQSTSTYQGDASIHDHNMIEHHATPTTFLESPSPQISGIAAKRISSNPALSTEDVMPRANTGAHSGVQVHIGKIELEVLAPPSKPAPPAAVVTQVIAPARAAPAFNPHRYYLRRS